MITLANGEVRTEERYYSTGVKSERKIYTYTYEEWTGDDSLKFKDAFGKAVPEEVISQYMSIVKPLSPAKVSATILGGIKDDDVEPNKAVLDDDEDMCPCDEYREFCPIHWNQIPADDEIDDGCYKYVKSDNFECTLPKGHEGYCKDWNGFQMIRGTKDTAGFAEKQEAYSEEDSENEEPDHYEVVGGVPCDKFSGHGFECIYEDGHDGGCHNEDYKASDTEKKIAKRKKTRSKKNQFCVLTPDCVLKPEHDGDCWDAHAPIEEQITSNVVTKKNMKNQNLSLDLLEQRDSMADRYLWDAGL